MNKIRFGNPELSVCMWFMSIVPLFLILNYYNLPLMAIFFIIISIIISLFAICWLPYLISKYHLRPGIDRYLKDETTWLRITKDHIVRPQFTDKGPYGQTKGTTYGEKADVIDDGSFPIKWMNGNSGIIMYDMLNVNINLDKNVARKQMQKKFGIRSGVEGYRNARKAGRVMNFDK